MTKEQLWEIIQDLDDRLSKLEGLLAEEIWKSEEPKAVGGKNK